MQTGNYVGWRLFGALVLVVMLAALSGCTRTASTTQVATQADERCAALNGFDRDSCYSSMAYELESKQVCYKIEDPDLLDICLESAYYEGWSD
ncbi:MAG: hypothetical protein WC350_06060 [Candidatus Micrarchaeia archaeon]|jgi:hypothetical protein